jgi:hypothetical protein
VQKVFYCGEVKLLPVVDELNPTQIKFFDSVVTPWRELNGLLSEHPLAANPDSNVLSSKAQSLVITLNHFREKLQKSAAYKVRITDDLRNLANSVKHSKGSETDVFCILSPTYECSGDGFRFIKNEIVCNYERANGGNAGREFLASAEIWAAVQSYAQVLGVDIIQFAPSESGYSFLPVAVAFSIPRYAAYTKSVQILFFRRIADGYEKFDPENVKFAVLGEEALGSDLSSMDWSFMDA